MHPTLALAAVAASIGALHTLAPDHWVPFAALARAERWSARRTAAVTAACGLGHVTVSVGLGLVSLFLGLELMRVVGQQLERVAGLLLIAFGVAYGLWGLHRAMRARIHARVHGVLPPHRHSHAGHEHHHHAHEDQGSRTAWTLFLLFSADPCVAVVPLMFAAVSLGWLSTLAVVVAYEASTIATMVGLALPARAAVSTVLGAWADRYGDALAGGIITAVGVFVAVVGI
jgi:nickel/cobalt transporter (NicO) family protein